MNANITLKSKVYNQVYADKGGSLRRSITDGATLPHELRIAHSDGVDSKSKLAIKRSLFRIDMTHLDTGGINPSPIPVTCYMVVQHGVGTFQPSTTAIELAVDSVCQALVSTAADGSALDLADDVFAAKEQ